MNRFLITGCSSGIGRGLACELVRRGKKVWGVARREEALTSLSRELGQGFSFSTCDVSRPEDVRKTMQIMTQAHFVPDVVILNAGINPEAHGAPFAIEDFERILKTNLIGALVWVDLFLPIFRARRGGQFAAISSLAASRGDARWIAYCASKAGLTRAFEAFRGRHAREGITFTTVHFGAVETGMGEASRSPFRLTTEQAAKKALQAIERRAESVTIPWFLRLVLEIMRPLPDAVFSRLVSGAFQR